MPVSMVIPVHNEEAAIGRVPAELPRSGDRGILVVDSNSTDGTPDIAAKMGPASYRSPNCDMALPVQTPTEVLLSEQNRQKYALR